VMFKENSPSPSRRASGGSLSLASVSLGEETDWREVPLLLARRDARWLARVAVRAALERFVGRGLALNTRAQRLGISGRMRAGSSGRAGGDGVGAVAIVDPTPIVGGAGGELLSPASLLSSLRLALLARSRLLLPEWCAWAWAAASDESLQAAVGRNQRVISSVFPSVSNTSLAGILSLLQLTHAKYWLCAQGGGRGGEPVLVLVWTGCAGLLLLPTGGSARVWSLLSPLIDPPLTTSAQAGEGEGGGEGC